MDSNYQMPDPQKAWDLFILLDKTSTMLWELYYHEFSCFMNQPLSNLQQSNPYIPPPFDAKEYLYE